jgi:deoxyribonuclease-4
MISATTAERWINVSAMIISGVAIHVRSRSRWTVLTPTDSSRVRRRADAIVGGRWIESVRDSNRRDRRPGRPDRRRGNQRGGDAAQIILGDPQSWSAPSFAYPAGRRRWPRPRQEQGVRLYVHSAYVINVASLNNRLRIPSRKLLQQTVQAAAEIGAAGVVVHGGHVTKDDDPEVGFDNWRKAVEGLELPVPLLIENTAGGTHAMARYLESIEKLWTAISAAENIGRVGFCLDTCHAFAAGLELDTVVEKVLAITGRIDLVHANDSQGGFNSGRDRHANFGQGKIEPEELADGGAWPPRPRAPTSSARPRARPRTRRRTSRGCASRSGSRRAEGRRHRCPAAVVRRRPAAQSRRRRDGPRWRTEPVGARSA